MLDRLRRALLGSRRSEGGLGATSDRHAPRSDDDSVARSPAHGDDEFAPRVPPDQSA
jgi:hypothetical protein